MVDAFRSSTSEKEPKVKTRIIHTTPEQPSHDGGRPADEGVRSDNIAGRVGRWSARHRRTAIIGWLLFVILSIAIGAAKPMV